MKMRNIPFAIIVTAILISSCKKELDQLPISSATTETFYKQPADYIQAVNATYNSLRNYPNRLMALSEIRSDNVYPVNDVARDHDPINNFSSNIAPNAFVEEAWTANYSGIFKANTVLDQIDKNGSEVITPALATRLTAEARFLRAFFYFDLIKYFGKVPLILRPLLANEVITIGRSPVDSVYKLVIDDLQFAIANLPANYSGAFPAYTATDVGRATRYAAQAVLAQVYMTRSGPTYGIEGPGMGLNEWNLALPLLTTIINSNQFALNPSFPAIFSYTNQNPTTNKEAVFDVMYLTGQNPVLGASFTWSLAPQDYFNSLPAGNNPANGTLGFPAVSANLFTSYGTNDARRSPTIHTSPFTYTGITYTQPFFRKYLDTTKIPASRFDWGINFIAIRYTDIIMLRAECSLRGTPSDAAAALTYVNQVRTRAGVSPLTSITLDVLFEERRREFAGEGLRWFDLQRSGNLLTIMNAWRATEDATLKKMSPITANHIIYPIPQSQIDAAPGLYQQNPGY
jgi:hypothetical protein